MLSYTLREGMLERGAPETRPSMNAVMPRWAGGGTRTAAAGSTLWPFIIYFD